jgi:hypothetical protein
MDPTSSFGRSVLRLACRNIFCTVKPVNSNMAFGTGFAFPNDNVPLNSTSLQIGMLFLWLCDIRWFDCTCNQRIYHCGQDSALGKALDYWHGMYINMFTHTSFLW